MIIRLIVCLAISILIHVLFIMHPFQVQGKKALTMRPIEAVQVGLVDIPGQVAALNPKVSPKPPSPPVVVNSSGEGVSFVAEGGVGKAYLDKLKVKIFNVWQYPADAIHKGQQGKVTISFVLNDKGELMDMGVLAGSGSNSLDSAAMAAVKKASPFGAFTGDIKENTLKVTGNFAYVLD
jgi:TonB family protein